MVKPMNIIQEEENFIADIVNLGRRYSRIMGKTKTMKIYKRTVGRAQKWM